MDDQRKWFDDVTANEPDAQIADKMDVSRTTVHRWRRRGDFDASNIILISRAYNVDPVWSLISTGFIRPDEFTENSMKKMLTRAPTPLLIEELHSRFLGKGGRVTFPFDLDPREPGPPR